MAAERLQRQQLFGVSTPSAMQVRPRASARAMTAFTMAADSLLLGQAVHEALVDLEALHRKLLEIAQ